MLLSLLLTMLGLPASADENLVVDSLEKKLIELKTPTLQTDEIQELITRINIGTITIKDLERVQQILKEKEGLSETTARTGTECFGH